MAMKKNFDHYPVEEYQNILNSEKQRLGEVDNYVELAKEEYGKLNIGSGPYRILRYKTPKYQQNHQQPLSVLISVMNQESKEHTLASFYFKPVDTTKPVE